MDEGKERKKMMRRRYFSALMFTAVLVFASPAGKTMASQVLENQMHNSTENMNVVVPSEAEKQVSGADDAITTVEEVFGEQPYYGPGETDGSYVYYSQVFPKDADQNRYLPEKEHVEGNDTYRLVDYEVQEQSLSGRKKHIRDTLLLKDYEGIDEIPETYKVEIADNPFQTVTEFTLPIKETKRVNERWEDSFTFDIVVEHADSGLFQIGNEVISLNQTVDPFAGNEGLLLELIGVPNDAYQIDHTAWAGNMYEQNGILYRNAVAYGKKLVYDLEISYEDVLTLPEEEGYQIRARYELLPKDVSVMSESTSKSSGSNRWDWLKNLWEEMMKFLKKIAETVKKHPYITAVVFFLLFIAIILYLAVRRRTKDAEEPEHVSRRWHRGPKRGRRR